MVTWLSKWKRRSTLSTPATPIEGEEEENAFQHALLPLEVPQHQSALLLYAIRQPYQFSTKYPIPTRKHNHELLVKVEAIGLNPIDWKAPDFNFGIPTLPYISGRELVGTVIQPPTTPSRIRAGDVVIIPSTDYRDLRKAAFQEYSIASAFNTIRLPRQISVEQGSIIGVAFVAAALTLGVCMGLSFENIESGPNLLDTVRKIDSERLPVNIRKECLEGIGDDERAKKGDVLVIWGGSSTCAHITKQLARLAGLRIISVVDSGKHGMRLSTHDAIRPDLLVDSHDPERAISVIRAATGSAARFGFDTQGKDTAAHLLRAITPAESTVSLPKDPQEYEGVKTKLPTPPSTPSERSKTITQRSHLIGLTGVPKFHIPEGAALHNVPIKLFHEIPEVGEALSAWCEKLLVKGLLVPPDVVGTVEGLEGINEGLNRLRRREISGGRLVAVLQ